MYSKKAWGGDTDPFVLTKFMKATPPDDEDPLVSLVVFEWRDEDYVGVWASPDAAEVRHLKKKNGRDADVVQKQYICDDNNVKASLCNQTQIGEFILNANHTQSRNPIISQTIHLKDPQPINYPVSKTGYYCVGTFGFSSDQYKAAVEFRNAYGELPAAQIAKLPFYGGLTIVYAVIAMFVYLDYNTLVSLTDSGQILGISICAKSP